MAKRFRSCATQILLALNKLPNGESDIKHKKVLFRFLRSALLHQALSQHRLKF